MGKLVRFDSARRRHVPNIAIKREILAAARRAGRGPPKRRAGYRWNPSLHLIVTVGLAAFFVFYLALYYWPVQAFPESQNSGSSADRESASFGFCHSGGGYNCVVDGDTIYYRGDKIRIADIDTPETHDYGCASELEQGNAATQRLAELLGNGPFSLTSIDRDTDRYGRLLRIAERDGESIGGMLVGEGLARWYEGGRQPWC
jgi:endonuclease YncB( thermonuclease family)